MVEMILSDDEALGVKAVSLVEEPAIEQDFIYMKSENPIKVDLEVMSEEKRIVMGPILIPNKPILRYDDDGNEYYIYFKKDTVRKIAERVMLQGLQSSATIHHEKPIEGVTLIETWLKEHEDYDKSNMYGMKAPVGTWLGAYKIENSEVWEDVKAGKVKGFSIEANFMGATRVGQNLAKETDLATVIIEALKNEA